MARGRAGGPPARGAAANRVGRGGATGGRGAPRQTARGVGRAKGNLPGKDARILAYRPPRAFHFLTATFQKKKLKLIRLKIQTFQVN